MPQPEFVAWRLAKPILCLVVDGLGGHEGGETASRLVAESLARDMNHVGAPDDMAGALRRANAQLYGRMASAPALIGMGATVAGLVASAQGILCFNVGDSRIYAEDEGFLRQITTDDARSAAGGRILTQALGGTEQPRELAPHISFEPAASGRYLLCTDGLTDAVGHDQLEACLSPADDVTVHRLFDAAMDAGGQDNISIVLVRLREPLAREAAP